MTQRLQQFRRLVTLLQLLGEEYTDPDVGLTVTEICQLWPASEGQLTERTIRRYLVALIELDLVVEGEIIRQYRPIKTFTARYAFEPI